MVSDPVLSCHVTHLNSRFWPTLFHLQQFAEEDGSKCRRRFAKFLDNIGMETAAADPPAKSSGKGEEEDVWFYTADVFGNWTERTDS